MATFRIILYHEDWQSFWMNPLYYCRHWVADGTKHLSWRRSNQATSWWLQKHAAVLTGAAEQVTIICESNTMSHPFHITRSHLFHSYQEVSINAALMAVFLGEKVGGGNVWADKSCCSSRQRMAVWKSLYYCYFIKCSSSCEPVSVASMCPLVFQAWLYLIPPKLIINRWIHVGLERDMEMSIAAYNTASGWVF